MRNSSVRDAKRVRKDVLVVALFIATASLGLMVTQPQAPTGHGHLLFDIYNAFVNLTLFTGIGLSVHSILARGVASARKQRWVMVIGLGFMAATFVLRTSIILTTHSLIFGWLVLLVVGVLILFVVHALGRAVQDPQVVPDPSVSHSPIELQPPPPENASVNHSTIEPPPPENASVNHSTIEPPPPENASVNHSTIELLSLPPENASVIELPPPLPRFPSSDEPSPLFRNRHRHTTPSVLSDITPPDA